MQWYRIESTPVIFTVSAPTSYFFHLCFLFFVGFHVDEFNWNEHQRKIYTHIIERTEKREKPYIGGHSSLFFSYFCDFLFVLLLLALTFLEFFFVQLPFFLFIPSNFLYMLIRIPFFVRCCNIFIETCFSHTIFHSAAPRKDFLSNISFCFQVSVVNGGGVHTAPTHIQIHIGLANVSDFYIIRRDREYQKKKKK